MEKEKKYIIIIVSSYLSAILILTSLSFWFYTVEAKNNEVPKTITQEEFTKEIHTYLLKEYDLARDDYQLTPIRYSNYEDEDYDYNVNYYHSTVVLKEPAVSFTIELDDMSKVTYDSYLNSISNYYLAPFIASLSDYTSYLTEQQLTSYATLTGRTGNSSPISIDLDFNNKKFKKAVVESLKKKQPLDFQQLLQDYHYVAWINFDLYTEKKINEKSPKQLELDLQEKFELLPQTYEIYLEQLDLTTDCSISEDEDTNDYSCSSDNYHYHEFRGAKKTKQNAI